MRLHSFRHPIVVKRAVARVRGDEHHRTSRPAQGMVVIPGKIEPPCLVDGGPSCGLFGVEKNAVFLAQGSHQVALGRIQLDGCLFGVFDSVQGTRTKGDDLVSERQIGR